MPSYLENVMIEEMRTIEEEYKRKMNLMTQRLEKIRSERKNMKQE